MAVYVRLLQGGAPAHGRVPAHTPEWSNFRAADPGQPSGALPEVDDQVLVSFETGDPQGASVGGWARAEGLEVAWDVPPYAQTAAGAALGAEIEFTRPDPRGAEIADLRVRLHDVRIVRSEHVLRAGGGAPLTRMAVACSRITLAGAPKSAPDVSHQVRARAAGVPAQAPRAR